MEEKEVIAPVSQEEAKKAFAEMAENKHKERVKEFKESGTLFLQQFMATQRFRSVRRAIRRGHVSMSGVIYPRRPFNNRKAKPGTITYERRKVYEQYFGRED